MVIIIYHLVIFIAVLLFVNYNSDFYWGQKYCKVYASKYITTAEKDSIKLSAYPIAILPLGYTEDSESAKKQITYNLKIVKKREKEAKRNKGVYSTEKSIKI